GVSEFDFRVPLICLLKLIITCPKVLKTQTSPHKNKRWFFIPITHVHAASSAVVCFVTCFAGNPDLSGKAIFIMLKNNTLIFCSKDKMLD
ncbi:hypothetical protein ACJX0J_024436, partial [Zea mays]